MSEPSWRDDKELVSIWNEFKRLLTQVVKSKNQEAVATTTAKMLDCAFSYGKCVAYKDANALISSTFPK